MSQPFAVTEVWNEAGTTLIAELPRRWDLSWSEPLNVPGVGNLTVALDDAVLARHAGLLDMGNVVKIWQGRGDGTGGYVSGFRIRQRETKFVSSDEWAGYVRTVSGPTLLADLDQGIVDHETAPGPDTPDVRAFFWGSKQGDWYDAADWSGTYNSWQWLDDPPSDEKTGQPAGWPEPEAYWLNTPSSAWEFWRLEVPDPGDDVTVEMAFTCDEVGRVFIDGALIISVDEFETGYLNFATQKWVLTGGDTHIVGIMVQSKNTPGGDGNDAFIFAMYTTDGNNQPVDYLSKSTATGWKVHGGTPPPGWRKAIILKTVVEEEADRDVRYLRHLSIGFTKDVDSASAAWTDSLSRNVGVGTTILDLQGQLSELNGFDVWVDPASMQIKAWKRRGTDRSTTVTLEPGRNLLDWSVSEFDEIRNSGPVKYDGGWTTYEDTTSVTAHGRARIGLSVGTVADDDTAQTLAEAIVASKSTVSRQAGAAEEIVRDEDSKPSGGLTWSVGAVPGLDFVTGDDVKCANRDGTPTKHRLLGLSTAEDSEGLLSWEPELEEAV